MFGAADIVTLPSHFEGLPNVVCEAMLSGRAVVASTAGGIPEIVQNERTGMLVPPRDVEPLSDALLRMSADGAKRELVAERARAFALEHLTWRGSAKRYETLYNDVLAERKSRPSATVEV